VVAAALEDNVYPGLEGLQTALRGVAGCCDGSALPGSALLLSALRAHPQAIQHSWVDPITAHLPGMSH